MYNISNENALSPMPLDSSVWRLSIRCASQALHLRSHGVSVWIYKYRVPCRLLLPQTIFTDERNLSLILRHYIHAIPSYTSSAQIYVKSSWVLVSYIRSVPTTKHPVASDPTSGEYRQAVLTDLKRDPSIKSEVSAQFHRNFYMMSSFLTLMSPLIKLGCSSFVSGFEFERWAIIPALGIIGLVIIGLIGHLE